MTCAGLADTGGEGPKFGKTYWCNTWTFSNIFSYRLFLDENIFAHIHKKQIFHSLKKSLDYLEVIVDNGNN